MAHPSLAIWGLKNSPIRQLTSGLINQTYWVDDPEGPWVLQQLNTGIFVPEVHEDIEAITRHLENRGLQTPRLRRTLAGELWHTAPEGEVWRLMSVVGDRTIEALSQVHDAREAGALVARFHGALEGFHWDFRSVRPGAHDTPAHMAKLERALADYPGHRLYDDVAALADRIFDAWGRWQGPSELPTRIIHGDLKISNVRFAGSHAAALIDLDTLAWGTLDVELGDAMRSWCNPASEDSTHAVFDVELFGAAMEGYGSACEGVSPEEWQAIVPGVERICLELASRFAQDALAECYFGFDPKVGHGEHNLQRARGQATLGWSVAEQRSALESVIVRVAR